MPVSSTSESRALIGSLVATAVLGAGAMVWGVLSGSRIILFDGVYLLAGMALVGISLLASRAATSAPSREYPFGRHAATPLAVAVQGAALLGALVYGAADAIGVIIDGGSPTAPTSVLAYGLVSAIASTAVVLWLRRYARSSALARAELISWRAGALMSLGVAIGGSVALLLTRAGSGAAVYVDPLLVLIACAAIAPMSIGLVRDGVRELLEAAPLPKVRDQIDAVVAAARAEYGLPTPITRATKLGRRLYVEVDFVVGPGAWSVDDEDAVRHSIIDRLRELDYEVWATVELTTDAALAGD